MAISLEFFTCRPLGGQIGNKMGFLFGKNARPTTQKRIHVLVLHPKSMTSTAVNRYSIVVSEYMNMALRSREDKRVVVVTSAGSDFIANSVGGNYRKWIESLPERYQMFVVVGGRSIGKATADMILYGGKHNVSMRLLDSAENGQPSLIPIQKENILCINSNNWIDGWTIR